MNKRADTGKKEDEEIIRTIGMSNLPKIIDVLYAKYHGKCQLIDIGGDCMFRFGRTNVANVSYLPVYIHFIIVKDNTLKVEGNVSWPAVLKKHFGLYILVNGKEYRCRMFDAGLDVACGGKVYETRTAFVFEKRLDEECFDVAFCYECSGIRCESGKINFMRFSPVADVLERQYAVCGGWFIWEERSHIKLKKESDQERIRFEQQYRNAVAAKLNVQEAQGVLDIRKDYFDRKATQKNAVWLFMDRIDKADDNGEAFFEYVCARKPENVDCYFVIDKAASDYARLSGIGNVVDALSKEHCILLLLAEYIFTSQLNGWVENPYGKWEEYFRDLYHRAKVVFLQHGITKDDQTKWLNRYNQNLYAIVCSAVKEKEAFLTRPYFYEERQVWNVGMPRLDRLYDNGDRFILFMPTWRKALMEQRLDQKKGVYQWRLKAGFKQSSYYGFYHRVLNDEDFLGKCEEAGYQIIFMPHPIMQPFVEEYQVSDSVVTPSYHTSWRELFANSSIMITDYSSVAFDFAYLKKPVIYCQFDRKDFFGSHTYQEGYFDYKKMGFGEVVTTIQELYKVVLDYMKNGCTEKKIYRKRIESFYSCSDKKCCQRLYEKVMEQNNGI